MSLLAGVCYDPASAVTKVMNARLEMTAFDTTNLRLNFNAPSNGAVNVRLRTTLYGVNTAPTLLLGVMSGSTVVARQSPVGGWLGSQAAATRITQESLFTVTGLTASASYAWDAAYGIEILLSSASVKYGGVDDNAGNNAWGGVQYEIYSCPNLLGSKLYDPVTSASKITYTLLPMTAIDTTNLRITFTAPASGNVLTRIRTLVHGATTFPQILLGVMSGSTVITRTFPLGGIKNSAVATAHLTQEHESVVTGLTSGSVYTWDAAYAVQAVVAATGIKYGGGNDTTTNNAFGGILYEIWGI